MHQLDRDDAPQLRVNGAINLSHAAGRADWRPQKIRIDHTLAQDFLQLGRIFRQQRCVLGDHGQLTDDNPVVELDFHQLAEQIGFSSAAIILEMLVQPRARSVPPILIEVIADFKKQIGDRFSTILRGVLRHRLPWPITSGIHRLHVRICPP